MVGVFRVGIGIGEGRGELGEPAVAEHALILDVQLVRPASDMASSLAEVGGLDVGGNKAHLAVKVTDGLGAEMARLGGFGLSTAALQAAKVVSIVGVVGVGRGAGVWAAVRTRALRIARDNWLRIGRGIEG